MIFVDTSFWIAVRNRADDHHADATALWAAKRGDRLVTTNHVRGETSTHLLRRVGRNAALDFAESLERTRLARIAFVTEQLEAEAWRWLRRHDERPYSFVDATSFALMRSLKMREALAFDGDFAAAGFVELRP